MNYRKAILTNTDHVAFIEHTLQTVGFVFGMLVIAYPCQGDSAENVDQTDQYLSLCPTMLHPATATTPRAPHLAPLACRRQNGLGKDGGTAVAGALGRLTALTSLGLW